MKHQFGLLILATVHVVHSCPEGWNKSEIDVNNCFYYIPEDATFEDAQKACKHVGGELIAPEGFLDTSAMSLIIQNSVRKGKSVWLDMKKLEGADEWTSSNGTEIFVHWYEGYPEGDGDCGVLLYGPIKMKNKRCSLKSSVLCRGSKSAVTPMTSTCPSLSYTDVEDPIIPGTYAYLRCEEGYKLSSSGHKKAYCRTDGIWSRSNDELARCQPEKCNTITIGEDVVETSVEEEMVGALRNFTCQPGAEFRRQKSVNDIIVECTADGVWVDASGAQLSSIEDCVPKVVGDGNPSNGEMMLAASKILSISAAALLLLVTL